MHRTRLPGILSLSLTSVAGWNEHPVPDESRGSKPVYCGIHQPESVASQCSLIAWLNGLACRDQRRSTGSSSALEVGSHNELYKSTSTLLYFTSLTPITGDGRLYIKHCKSHIVLTN